VKMTYLRWMWLRIITGLLSPVWIFCVFKSIGLEALVFYLWGVWFSPELNFFVKRLPLVMDIGLGRKVLARVAFDYGYLHLSNMWSLPLDSQDAGMLNRSGWVVLWVEIFLFSMSILLQLSESVLSYGLNYGQPLTRIASGYFVGTRFCWTLLGQV